ncbi:MAG: helix-hairpin-helix domain-containing protein [Candidatus Caldatribacteriaceae bacterium]
MTSFSRQERLVLLLVASGAVVALTLVLWINFGIQRKSQERESIFIVQIDGAVTSPGIYQVREGTRLFEVLEMAKGATANADLSGLNLAQPVYDGQRISIPSRKNPGQETLSFSTNLGDLLQTKRESLETTTPNRINVNTASLEELVTLPGIGEVIAQRIIDYRKQHGPFRQLEDLLGVQGIGPKKLEKIKDLITF